ncbi:MAG: putative manganese-dependent inorganic diphosphatase [Lachnospiraceae bacterium]|jgi:manganese-dependent inorganic pyrophosphatase|nr:putative manganese-dependent inorganic diphosphatase [Lachnospiraceae bacterium]
MKERPVAVIGHRNPDTDSICSAIVYANLKRIVTGRSYEARSAGHLNEETRYVLRRFGVEEPRYLATVEPLVRDVELQHIDGVSEELSLKNAWSLMKEANVVTLPILNEGKLDGLITIGDIARSYMEEHDSDTVAVANTPYRNILDTLDGTLVVGDAGAYFDRGKVVIAAANPDVMEEYIDEHDMVILGNRYESQLCAIEMKAGCIVVCLGSPVSRTIQKLAKQAGCAIICTPFDTYTVARLINQSIPVRYFMKKDNLIAFHMDDYVEDIRAIMAKKRHRNFPILDKKGNYVGMIGRRNLLDMKPRQVIMVDHNEKNQAVPGIMAAEILEIIDHHRLGSIETINPVYFRNQPLGCTATIVYQMYLENHVQIEPAMAGLLCSAIVSDTLLFRSPTCTPVDKEAAGALAEIAGVSLEELAGSMFGAGSNLSGKTDEEIFYQDFKKFNIQNISLGVAQISSMNRGELEDLRERMLPYMERNFKSSGLDILLFMLTNIAEESTDLLFLGAGARDLIETAFEVGTGENIVCLPGVVSRKKQMVPAILRAIQKLGEA